MKTLLKTLLVALLLIPLCVEALTRSVLQAVVSRRWTYEETVRDLSPVGYWRLGEVSGTTAREDSGFYDGTYINTPTLGVDGLVQDGDTCVTFAAASSEYMDGPDVAALDFIDPFTVMCWIDNTQSAALKILIAKEFQNTDGYALRIEAGETLHWKCANGGANSNVTASTNVGDTRHFVGATHAGTTGRIYVDGVEANSGSQNDPAAAVANFRIGARSSVDIPFNGTVDEVAVFKYEVSPAHHNLLHRLGIGQDVTPSDF